MVIPASLRWWPGFGLGQLASTITYDVNDFGAEAWGHVRQFIDDLRAVRP